MDTLAISWLFLAVTIVGAGFTVAALVPARRLSFFVVPYFFAGWLAGELAAHHIAWQAVATIVFVSLGALDAWPGRIGLLITVVSWGGLLAAIRRSRSTAEVIDDALNDALGRDYRDTVRPHAEDVVPTAEIARPFKTRRREVERVRHIAYGDAGARHTLDIHKPRVVGERRPVLLQIHGGAWVIGRKDQQGQPLMNHLAARGWVCVAPNYRLSPKVTFPDHLIDVKRALAWVREHIAEHGGDPDFIVVTGGSAGGHLSSLVALTPNRPEYQPGFEDVDTTVAACVPFYGVYDFLERHGARKSMSMQPFLEKLIMKCSPTEERDRWIAASPIDAVNADAPPFFVIHGTHDSLAYIEDARAFVSELRKVSKQAVVYAELPGAQHAFETFHSLRTAHTIRAVSRFLHKVHAAYLADDEIGRSAAAAPQMGASHGRAS